MYFTEKAITLKDGRTCILKPPTPEMAEEMIGYMKQTAAETPYLGRYPDEVKDNPDDEKEFLRKMVEDPHALMIVAETDGKMAGNCSFQGISATRKYRHRCGMGIALLEAYWGLGIGTAMIGFLTEQAKQAGFEQMELTVVADNLRAQALYRKCGFTESGRRHHAMKFDDGSYHDEILMYKEL